jgi:hypothetical protein
MRHHGAFRLSLGIELASIPDQPLQAGNALGPRRLVRRRGVSMTATERTSSIATSRPASSAAAGGSGRTGIEAHRQRAGLSPGIEDAPLLRPILLGIAVRIIEIMVSVGGGASVHRARLEQDSRP